MMRNWKVPGNRGGESMAALSAGGDKVSAYRSIRKRRGHAAMFALVAAAMMLWLVTFASCSFAGVPLLIREGLSIGELKRMREHEDEEIDAEIAEHPAAKV